MPDEPGEIITIAEVKTLLQITGDSKDALITMLIPIVESDLLTHLHNDFAEHDGYPPALKGYLADMIGYRAKKDHGVVLSETVSRYSVTYGGANDFIDGYPGSIMKGLNKWRKVHW
jgi:hypothetical protein